MSALAHYLRRMWRASLTAESLLCAEEAAEALPVPGPEALAWIRGNVKSAGEVAGVPVYRWGDVMAAVAQERTSAPSSRASDLLTTEEVAEFLRVPVARVHAWCAEGKLAHLKLGHRTVRFRRDDVIAFERQAVVAGTGARDADPQEERRVVRRLPLPGPRDRPVEAIQAYDWTHHHQKGG
ncbi:helix-turn-helix domain-containing protein [Myxococcota bacterium]|nr:helix-turn-helix domain-containing protein [Myxococcota bacterium]